MTFTQAVAVAPSGRQRENHLYMERYAKPAASAGLWGLCEQSAHVARAATVVSGHLIKPAGVARLRRWKALDAVLATGCPPAR